MTTFNLTQCIRLTKSDGSNHGFYFQITATDEYGRTAQIGGTYETDEKYDSSNINKLVIERATEECWKEKLTKMLDEQASIKKNTQSITLKTINIKESKIDL